MPLYFTEQILHNHIITDYGHAIIIDCNINILILYYDILQTSCFLFNIMSIILLLITMMKLFKTVLCN